MKKIRIILLAIGGLIILYFGSRTYRRISVVNKPITLKTAHFVILYQGIYPVEAQEVADNLEKNYDRIRNDLADPEHDTIRVFVHSTQIDFNQGTGLLNSHANGTSRGPNEFHLLWTNWYNSILPNDPIKTAIHEFTHCVQLNILIKQAQGEITNKDTVDFNGVFENKFMNEYPQWFWEALCDYEAGIVNDISVNYGMRKNPTINYLNNSNQIYNVGYTIIEYIVKKWGKEKLPILITSYVDIETVLLVSDDEFEKGWKEFVNHKY